MFFEGHALQKNMHNQQHICHSLRNFCELLLQLTKCAVPFHYSFAQSL
jgi:hypothetical protein